MGRYRAATAATQPISDPALQITLFGGPTGTHPVALAHGAPKNGKVSLKLRLPAAVARQAVQYSRGRARRELPPGK